MCPGKDLSNQNSISSLRKEITRDSTAERLPGPGGWSEENLALSNALLVV